MCMGVYTFLIKKKRLIDWLIDWDKYLLALSPCWDSVSHDSLSHLSSVAPCHSNKGCWHCGRWARWGPAAGSLWGRRRTPLPQSGDCSPSRRHRVAAEGRYSSARRLQRHRNRSSWPVRHGRDTDYTLKGKDSGRRWERKERSSFCDWMKTFSEVLNVFLKKKSVRTACFYFVWIINRIKQYFKKAIIFGAEQWELLCGDTLEVESHLTDTKKELECENNPVHDWLTLRCWLELNAFELFERLTRML